MKPATPLTKMDRAIAEDLIFDYYPHAFNYTQLTDMPDDDLRGYLERLDWNWCPATERFHNTNTREFYPPRQKEIKR